MEIHVNFSSQLVQFFLEWEMFQKKFVENQNTHFTLNHFFFNRAVYEIMLKKQNMKPLLIFHSNYGCTNAAQS
jgi:hypothetical protein